MAISSSSPLKPSHHTKKAKAKLLNDWRPEERVHLDSPVTAGLPAECSHTGDLTTPDGAELPVGMANP